MIARVVFKVRNPEAKTRCSQCGAPIPEGRKRFRYGCEECGRLVTVCEACSAAKWARPSINSIGCRNHPGTML